MLSKQWSEGRRLILHDDSELAGNEAGREILFASPTECSIE